MSKSNAGTGDAAPWRSILIDGASRQRRWFRFQQWLTAEQIGAYLATKAGI